MHIAAPMHSSLLSSKTSTAHLFAARPQPSRRSLHRSGAVCSARKQERQHAGGLSDRTCCSRNQLLHLFLRLLCLPDQGSAAALHSSTLQALSCLRDACCCWPTQLCGLMWTHAACSISPISARGPHDIDGYVAGLRCWRRR